MSTVRDSKGNIVNARAPQLARYSEDGLTIDWFDTHPPVKSSGSVDAVDDQGKTVEPLPSADDLDAIADEERIRLATSTPSSDNDVPSVQLPSGRPDEGLAGEPAVLEPTVPSDSPAGDVPAAPPSGSGV
jgi:hypothetical protein